MKKLLGVLASALLAGLAFAGTNGSQAGDEQSVIAKQLPSYPLSTCLVSGEPLTAMGEPMDVVHEGRLVRLCCKGCVKGLKKDPAAVLAKVDEALIAAQIPTYPTDKCLVSDEPLTEMGEPLDMLYGTRLVRFCCKGCIKEFKKDPQAVLARLDAAAKKQG